MVVRVRVIDDDDNNNNDCMRMESETLEGFYAAILIGASLIAIATSGVATYYIVLFITG
jgi:hypothetical protein